VVASAGPAIPTETQGPFPADGSNGPNVLAQSGVVRGDLTTSFGSASGTAAGVPLTFRFTVVDAATGDPRPGTAVYAWHCTADGRYSVYQVTDQNYLRGVQVADEAGRVTFTSVVPGCYPGRWPHCHFEVYDDLDAATRGSQARKVSQLALPRADCEVVYAEAAYGAGAANLARLSLESDMVFRDGWADQLATVSGSVADGYTASLLVRV
jgi:protocatechuate 3,4-dioxygenase beta subunit